MLLRVLFLWLFCGSVFAQAFPAKPIRIVVGYPPGGSGDFTTRLVADEMAKELGVAVIADNRPGAGGNIAAEIVAKAPADGYTLLNAWHHAINIALYKSTNYQEKDFAAVCRVATGGLAGSIVTKSAGRPSAALRSSALEMTRVEFPEPTSMTRLGFLKRRTAYSNSASTGPKLPFKR